MTTRLAATLLSATLLLSAAPAGHQAIELRATWADGETWTRYSEPSDQTEVGLGLLPTGAAGPPGVAFVARWPGRRTTGTPRAILVQVAAGPTTNPKVLRTPTLTFIVEDSTGDQQTLDLSNRLTVNDPGAGAFILSGSAEIRREELRRAAGATRLRADLLGFEVTFTADQIRAIREFAGRVTRPGASR